MIHISFIITYDSCIHLVDIIEESLTSSYIPMYVPVFVSEQSDLQSRHFVVVNGPVHGVSVPNPFINDAHIFYVSHMMCANTW